MQESKIKKIRDNACLASSALATAVILGNGPVLQEYISKTIKSSNTSIYSSTYGNTAIKIPEIEAWVPQTMISPYLICFIVFYAVLKKYKSTKDVFILGALFSIICITLLDMWVGVQDKKLSLGYLVENLLFNTIGAIALSMILISLTKLSVFLSSGESSKIAKTITGFFGPLCIAVLASMVTYYGSILLYQPTVARVEIATDPNFLAIYTAPQSQNLNSEHSRFGIFDGKVLREGNLVVSAPEGELKTTINASEEIIPTSTMTAFIDCDFKELENLKIPDGHRVSLGEDREIKVTNDIGLLDLAINDVSGTIDYSSEIYNHIVTSYTEDDLFQVERRTSTKDPKYQPALLKYSPVLPYTKIVFAIPTAKTTEHSLKLANRAVRIEAGDKKFIISFIKPERAESDGDCRSTDLSSLGSGGYIRVPTKNGVGGIVITTREKNVDISNIITHSTNIEILNTSDSYVKLNNLDNKEMSDVLSPGWIKEISIYNGVSSVNINNKDISLHGQSSVQMVGEELFGAALTGGGLRIYGTANTVYIDEIRANSTRWEGMDDVTRNSLLVVLGVMFLAWIKIVASWIKEDRNLY